MKSLELLKPGGILVSIVGGAKEPVQQAAAAKAVHAKNYLVHSHGGDMRQLAAMLAAGQLRPTISHTYTFNEIAEAHRLIESGRTRGKLIVNAW